MLNRMGALADLWKSERGLVAIVILMATSVLCALGHITTDQWLEHTRWVFVTYAAAKTVTGTAAMLARPSPDSAEVLRTSPQQSSPNPPSTASDGVPSPSPSPTARTT